MIVYAFNKTIEKLLDFVVAVVLRLNVTETYRIEFLLAAIFIYSPSLFCFISISQRMFCFNDERSFVYYFFYKAFSIKTSKVECARQDKKPQSKLDHR